jgi:hypothetical protein
LLVPRRGPAAGLRAERGGKRRRASLDDGDLAARGGRGGRQLGADPPGADDGEPQSGPEQRAQRERVVLGPHEPLPPGTGQRHRDRPGGHDQVVTRVFIAIRDKDGR